MHKFVLVLVSLFSVPLSFAETLLLSAEVASLRSTNVSVPRHEYAGWSRKVVWLAEEGTVVEAGGVVASFDSETIQQRFEQIEQQLISARDNAISQQRAEELALVSAERRIRVAELELEKAQLEKAKITDFSSKKEAADAEFAVESAQTELQKAREAYEYTQARNEAQSRGRELSLANLERELSFAEAELNSSQVITDEAVLVLYAESRFQSRKVQVGDSLDSGSAVLRLLPVGDATLRAWLSEVDLLRLNGQSTVNIVFDAFPSESFSGEIIRVDDAGQLLPQRGVGRWMSVEIRLPETLQERVRPGMAARVEVEV